MKTFKSTVILTAAFLLLGMLFFSCAFENADNYGTLLIKLPGSESSRATVSSAFINTLSYEIECTSPGKKTETKKVSANTSAPIPMQLAEGTWVVSVKVINAADNFIGGEERTVSIEKNVTTELKMTIPIDATRCNITKFAMTYPVNAAGVINTNNNTITVKIPHGSLTAGASTASFSATHEGVSISPSLTNMNINAGSSFRLTVTAENGGTKSYNVYIEEQEEEEPIVAGTWPVSAIWARYGLTGITQPAGTTVTFAGIYNSNLSVVLFNAGMASFEHLVSCVESNDISGEMEDSGEYRYEASYPAGAPVYDLFIEISPEDGNLYFSILYSSSPPPEWPSSSVWETYLGFNINAPTTSPGSFLIEIVTESLSPYLTLSVDLSGASAGHYDELLGQLAALDVVDSITDGTDRYDVFKTAGTPSKAIVLQYYNNWISIYVAPFEEDI